MVSEEPDKTRLRQESWLDHCLAQICVSFSELINSPTTKDVSIEWEISTGKDLIKIDFVASRFETQEWARGNKIFRATRFPMGSFSIIVRLDFSRFWNINLIYERSFQFLPGSSPLLVVTTPPEASSSPAPDAPPRARTSSQTPWGSGDRNSGETGGAHRPNAAWATPPPGRGLLLGSQSPSRDTDEFCPLKFAGLRELQQTPLTLNNKQKRYQSLRL